MTTDIVQPQPSRRTPFRDHAAAYARAGWRVFPLRPGRKIPQHNGGHKNATTDPAQIERWGLWLGARCNVGIATGAGLVVIDVDPRNGGSPDPSWPETLTARTASGGWHFYYAVHPSHAIKSRPCHALGPGIDVKAGGGYVVAPGSVLLERGEIVGTYEWADPSTPIAPLPDDMFAAVMRDAAPARRGAVNGSYGPRFEWPEEPHTITTHRHDFMLSAAGSLAARGVAAMDMEGAMREADALHCWPSWADDEPRNFAALVRAAEGWCER